MDVRLRHNLQQGHARPVVIHQRCAVVHVGQLTRVFFHVYPPDANAPRRAIDSHVQPAIHPQRLFVLANLVPFGQVRVEVVFAGKDVVLVNLTVQRQSDAQGVFHRFFVNHRQCARHSETEGGYGRVRFRCHAVHYRHAGKHLRLRHQFRMNFQANNRFVFVHNRMIAHRLRRAKIQRLEIGNWRLSAISNYQSPISIVP